MPDIVPISAPSAVVDVSSYAVSAALAIAFVFIVVCGVRMAFRRREESDRGLMPVMVGFIAAGGVSALVAALL